MSEFFFKALDEDEGKTKDKNFFFDALDQDESISKPKDFFFDALDADTNLSAGSDAPPVSGSNQPSLSFDPSLIEPIGSSMIGNPIEANTLMANEIATGNQPQVITYEPEPVSDPTLLSPEEAEFERLNRIMMQPGPKPNINLNPSISQVQGDFGNFRVSENAGYIANLPLSNTEALKQIAKGNVYEASNNALSRGVGRLSQVTNILGQQLGLKDTSQFIARMQELDRIYPDAPKEVQDALKKISEADTYSEALIEMTKNLGAVLSVVGESFPMMLPGLAAATGVTLTTGNPFLGAAVIGASSGSVEFGNVLMEELRASKVDMNDNAALEELLSNGEFWARARKRATARGVPIALFDALSFGIAGKLTGLARGSGIGRTSAAVATESVVLQPGLGGAGERVAQEAEKQLGFRDEINPGEVALEAVSEAPIGVIETATGIARERANEDPVTRELRQANKELDRADDPNVALQIATEVQQTPQDIDYIDKNLELAVQYENLGTSEAKSSAAYLRRQIDGLGSDNPKRVAGAETILSKQNIDFHTNRIAEIKAEVEGTATPKPKPENVFESTMVQFENANEKKKLKLAMEHPEAGPVLKDMADKMQQLSDRMYELGYIWYEVGSMPNAPEPIKKAREFMANMGIAMRVINRTRANTLGYKGKLAVTDEQLKQEIGKLQSLISAPESFPSLENVQANPEAPNVKTTIDQPTEPSAAASTVDVTEQSDPTLTRDDPADLVAPSAPEQPTIPEQPEPIDVKTDAPTIEQPKKTGFPKPNEFGVYSREDVKPNDKFEISIAQPKNWQGGKTARLSVLEISKGKWVRSIDAQFGDTGFSSPLSASGNQTFPSREAAIKNAIMGMRRNVRKDGPNILSQKGKKQRDGILKFLEEIETSLIKDFTDTQPISKPPTKPSKPKTPKGIEGNVVPVMQSETTTDVDSVVPEKSVKGTKSGRIFMQTIETLRQSTYRGAFRDAGVDPNRAANLSTGNQFRILDRTLKQKYGFTFIQPPRTGATYDSVNTMLDAYHNLQWMTHALNLPTKAIGLDGTLGLALPQRAWGGYFAAYMAGGGLPSNARSDIDPVTGPVVIMPKRSNSFAHEWGHALDYFLMDKYGSKESRGITGVVRSNLKNGTRPWQDGTPLSVTEAMGSVMNAMFFDKADVALQIKQAEQEVARLQAKQDKTSKPILALGKAKERLQKLIEGSTRTKVGKTDYRKSSGEFGATQGMEDYYLRPTEMFARAFEAYVANAVQGAGGKNEFITQGDDAYSLTVEQVKGADIRLAKTYPNEADRANIFLAMDRLMEAIRTEAIQEGTVAEAPGDMDAIDAVSEFNDGVEANKKAELKDMPKRVAEAIIGDQTRAYRTFKREAENIANRPSKYTSKTKRGKLVEAFQDSVGAVFWNTKRQILFNIANRHKDNPKVKRIMEQIISRIATDPGSLEKRVTVEGGTFEEGVRNSGRRFFAIYDQLTKKHKFDEYTDAQMKQLRLILTSDETATANADQAVIDAAGDLRTRLLNPMYDYMIQNGSEINYVQGNGYMPRMLDALLVLNDKAKFIGKDTPGRGAYNLYADVIYENEYGAYEQGSLSQMKDLLSLSKKLDVDLQSVEDLVIAMENIKITEDTIKSLKEEGRDTAKQEAKLKKQIEEASGVHEEAYNDLRDPYAEAAANDWFDRIQGRLAYDPSANGAQGKFAKKRKLPPEADSYMVDFYLNTNEAILEYIPSVVRKTEFDNRFGAHLVPKGKRKKGGLPAQQKNYMEYLLEEAQQGGLTANESIQVKKILETVTGTSTNTDSVLASIANKFNAFGTMALLERAVLSSVAEPITAAVQTGSVRDGLKTLAYSFDGLFTGLRGENARRRKIYYDQLANIMGVIDLPQTGDMIANRFGGTAQEDAKSAKYLSMFFLRSGLTRVTIAQRKAAMRTGMQYIQELAKQYQTGTNPKKYKVRLASANPDTLAAEAKDVLQDFGVRPEIMDEFTKYMVEIPKDTNGLVMIDNIIEASGQLTDMGKILSLATSRFVDQTIQDPKIIDRPMYAETPIGRIVFGIQSFISAFQRNVLEMGFKRAKRDYDRDKLAGASSLVMTTIAPLATLYAGHLIVSSAREALFNPDKLREEAEDDNLMQYLLLLGVSRSGFLGRADPVVNAFVSLKYQADLSNVVVGASGAYYLKAAQRVAGVLGERNSENTVAAEYQAVRGVYDVLIPTIGALAQTSTGISPLLGYGVGAANAFAQSPAATHWVTRNIIKQLYNEEYYPSGGGRGKSKSDRVY